jgi:hypothetical protein
LPPSDEDGGDGDDGDEMRRDRATIAVEKQVKMAMAHTIAIVDASSRRQRRRRRFFARLIGAVMVGTPCFIV